MKRDGSAIMQRAQRPMPRLDRAALAVAILSLPIRLVLALATELSPDEAYYLAAARLRLPIVDHPPLTVWLFRIADACLGWLPLELRVRTPTLILATISSLLLVDLVRRRGGRAPEQRWAAMLSAWLLLPMAGGFLATPDAPAFACTVALIWAESLPSPQAAALLASGASLLGCLAKVTVFPVALIVALASRRGILHRLAICSALILALPWCVHSAAFQVRHVYEPQAWSAIGALLALGAALFGQVALWIPVVVAIIAWRHDPENRIDRWLVGGLGAAFVASALVRAVPPEPNWPAPAWAPLIILGAQHLSEARFPIRLAVILTGPLLTLVLASHLVSPWLPLSRHADPSARIHGWSGPTPPVDAPGIGWYGEAAEACIYQRRCEEIIKQFHDDKRQ